MRFFRHFRKLIQEFMAFAWQNKVWWIVPMLLVLLLMTLLIVVTQTSVPALIYTLF